jgi:hypothetical protein
VEEFIAYMDTSNWDLADVLAEAAEAAAALDAVKVDGSRSATNPSTAAPSHHPEDEQAHTQDQHEAPPADHYRLNTQLYVFDPHVLQEFFNTDYQGNLQYWLPKGVPAFEALSKLPQTHQLFIGPPGSGAPFHFHETACVISLHVSALCSI